MVRFLAIAGLLNTLRPLRTDVELLGRAVIIAASAVVLLLPVVTPSQRLPPVVLLLGIVAGSSPVNARLLDGRRPAE